ncbi:LuxR C-terminal-related transcriptional regulator, partial [Lachnospiraceae bacterium OttesenSCG-928-D06]|nr:LuxR C-terminal-related transcriptional regulator [Lachnospiraceae bacterium OttesenSCG-928-D06]
SSYPTELQKLLIQLSLLDSFTMDFVAALYEKTQDKLPNNYGFIFEKHSFLMKEASTDCFFFHQLYQLFLLEKSYLLSLSEKNMVWQEAAAYYMENGNYIKSISCYRKCNDYAKMIDAIMLTVRSQNEYTAQDALYFLEHIELLSEEERKLYKRADYLRAFQYMVLVRLEESETLLLQLVTQLYKSQSNTDKDLLCEVYSTLGIVHMMQNKEDFVTDFKNAASLLDSLPFITRNKYGGKMRIHDAHSFSMADNKPGARIRMEQAVHDAIPYMTKVWSGDIAGMEHLFSAEASYLCNQLEDSAYHAYETIATAEQYGQYDLACNAYFILARIGLIKGNLSEMTLQMQNLRLYVKKHDLSVLHKIKDTALAWYYIRLHDYKHIPSSILDLSKTELNNLSYGRPQLVYANYLFNLGEYARIIGMLEHPRGLYLARGIWPDRISQFIMLALAHHYSGNIQASMDALWLAYDMCYQNGLVTLFIECGHHMAPLIENVRNQTQYHFAEDFLEYISVQSHAFAKETEILRNTYHRQSSLKKPKQNHLTKREQEFLYDLSLGYTREEISHKEYVSLNTVKSTIRNIYRKLGANNCAEAISIAISKGLIESYSKAD